MKRKTIFSIIKVLVLIIVLIVLISIFKKDNNFDKNLLEKGFTESKEQFICKSIKWNSKLVMTTRKYSFIMINGEVYDITFGKTYENNQNCIKRKFSTKIKAHIDNVLVGENKKYYVVYDNLSEKEDMEFPYDIKDIVMKADKYVLKTDGNIYYQEGEKLSLKYKGSSLKGKVQSISVIDSDYREGEEKKILVITNKAIYYSYSESSEKCRKFSYGSSCDYQLKKDNFLSKYRREILYVDDTILITKQGKVLYTNNYFGA